MKRTFVLICYHAGLWGVLGFFVTLFLGFLSCCFELPQNIFYILLAIFAIVGITAGSVCVSRGCKKAQ